MTNQPEALHHTKYLTVVYRDIKPGDEARELIMHPKMTASSWSHVMNERDRLQDENTTLQQGYAAARLEIESLRARSVVPRPLTADERAVFDAAMLDGVEIVHGGRVVPADEYPALPEPDHVMEDWSIGGVLVDYFTTDQMRAFADATHALRASHGQAPAQEAPAAVHSDLRARCVELLAWRETGTLPGEALRTLAREKYGDRYDALQRAERDTETEALNLVAAAPATQPAPQADSQPAVDALAEAEYFIDNPSAWSNFDQRASDAIAAVCKAFRASHGQAPAQAAPELTETAVTAKNPAAPVSSFEDSRTQAVYEVLVNDNYPPAGSNEHWEGWKARLIVDALFPIEAPAAVAWPSEILEKVDTLIASINEAHISKDAEWKRGCFAAADSVYEQIKEMLASATTTQPAPQPSPASQGNVLDTALLDWLDENIFYRDMSEWDAKYGHGSGYNMWVLFAPKGAQGSARSIIDAARAAQEGKSHG